VRAHLLVAALALGAACVGTGCKPTAELEPCNVADGECQLDIYYALLRLRGDGADPFLGVPPIRTLTVEEYERELWGGKPPEPEPPPDEEEEPKEEEPKKVDPWDVTLQLLGLIRPRMSSVAQGVRDRVQHVAAFYSSDTRTVTVIDRGGARNDFWDTALLTHELVHALQDDELSGWNPDSSDAVLARRAMIEGEATLYEDLTILGMRGRERTDEEWEETYADRIRSRREAMPGARSPYHEAPWFVYSLGAYRLMMGAYLSGGNAGVRHVLGDPPRSSAELMLYSAGEPRVERPALDCKLDPPGPDFTLAGYDRFGGLHVYGFLTKAGLTEEDAWEIASRVTDDRLWIYFDKEAGEVAASWRQRYAGGKDARRVVEGMAGEVAFTAEADGNDLVIRASNVAELLDEWPGAANCR
jgi:hypothetical protein